MSAELGSNWFEKLIVAGLPSSTGPLLARSAVGATLLTWTLVVYSLKPPSLSMIRALTVWSEGRRRRCRSWSRWCRSWRRSLPERSPLEQL